MTVNGYNTMKITEAEESDIFEFHVFFALQQIFSERFFVLETLNVSASFRVFAVVEQMSEITHRLFCDYIAHEILTAC